LGIWLGGLGEKELKGSIHYKSIDVEAL